MSFNSIKPASPASPASDWPDCAPYQTIPNAARISGLSEYALRKGCKDGTIQHIKVGRVYYVYMPGLYNPGPGGGGCPNS